MLARFYDLYFKIAFYIVNNYKYFFEKRLTPGFWKIKTKIHQQTTFIYMQQLVHYNKCCRRKVRLMNLLLALGWIFFILNQNKKKKTLITSLFNLRKKSYHHDSLLCIQIFSSEIVQQTCAHCAQNLPFADFLRVHVQPHGHISNLSLQRLLSSLCKTLISIIYWPLYSLIGWIYLS